LKVSPATNMMETKPKKLLGNCYQHIMGITLTHQSGMVVTVVTVVTIVTFIIFIIAHYSLILLETHWRG
jgi:hypothetical protein